MTVERWFEIRRAAWRKYVEAGMTDDALARYKRVVKFLRRLPVTKTRAFREAQRQHFRVTRAKGRRDRPPLSGGRSDYPELSFA